MRLTPAQQETPATRRQPAAVERDRHLLAANGWQCEGEKVIFVHDGCGVPRSLAEPALATESCDKSRLSATSVTQNRSSRCIRRASGLHHLFDPWCAWRDSSPHPKQSNCCKRHN